MITTDSVLSSDITTLLFVMKKVRELPVHLQTVFYDDVNKYLSSDEQDEKEMSLYNLLDLMEC